MTDEDIEILKEFIAESMESLEDVEGVLMDLEKIVLDGQTPDEASLNKIFRAFHSMKGSAGFLDLNMIASVTHHAETFLDKIRKGELSLTEEHISFLLELTDFFKTVLSNVEETFSDDGFEENAETYTKKLEELIENKSAPEDDFWAAAGEAPAQETGDSVAEEPEAEDFVAQFISDSKILLEQLEDDILALEKEGDNKQITKNVFRNLHSLKGNAGLLGFNDIASVCHEAESSMETLKDSPEKINAKCVDALLEIVDQVRKAVQNIERGEDGNIPEKERLLATMRNSSLPKPENPAPAVQEPKETKPPKAEPEEAKSEEPSPEAKPKDEKKQVVPAKKQKPAGDKAVKAKHKPLNEVIRVDVQKLNKLMDLVGEIVIAESMVSNYPEIRLSESPEFEKAISHLKKNIRELQELSTSMRMIPLSGLFRKMVRLVRDLSTKMNKKVELVIRGEETEMDRSVIEHISDPLVHIIRNAVDHGIEPEEVRIKNGKKPSGTIILEAKQVGSEIWIIVQDDGAGLNREKILKKASEKGLIRGDGSELPDKNVWPLIFKPGFSTAEKVTDVSGRGVGMDVVLKNIEEIRGRVNIESHPGEGAVFQLRIPLTTAIIDGMLIRVKDRIYAIPILDVRETLQISDSSVVEMVDGLEILSLRDELIPILRLQEIHHICPEKKPIEEGVIIVAESSGMRVSIFADEIIDQQQLVIKPIPSYLEKHVGLSGCAILGDGEICTVLDVADLIRLSEKMETYQE